MAIVSISPAGSVGLVEDVAGSEAPPAAWSVARNVRFSNGACGAVAGPLPLPGTMPVQMNWCYPTQDPNSTRAVWLLAGATSAYAYIDGVYTDITRISGAYTGQLLDRWQGGSLNGVLFANNGKDVPQVWLTPANTTKLIDLPNWPANTKTSCIRAYKQFLVALDVTKNGDRYRSLVKWSHPADPGSVPPSWDETDPTKDAGEYPLSETLGTCVDCVPLRDSAIIYKTDSVWGMQYIGGTFIFRFYKIFDDFGMPKRDCAVEFTSGKHVVFTGNDLIVHDGQQAASIAQGRVRTRLRALSEEQIGSCYMFRHPELNEVWFCYRAASDGGIQADTAIIYNWVSNTLTTRTLPNYYWMALGKVDPPGQSNGEDWDSATQAWAELQYAWGETLPITGFTRAVGLGDLSLDWADGNAITMQPVLLEREYLGVVMRAQQPPDMTAVKFVVRLWPRIVGREGTVINITLGSSMGVGRATDWDTPRQFIIGQDEWIDCTLSGRLFAIRLESQATGFWRYLGMDAEIHMLGVA